MSSTRIAEIKSRVSIYDVWSALGGGQLRRGRGQSFWRNGDGYNVALDARRGLWYDHAANEGGDVVGLVQIARGCSFVDAIEWLSDHTGISVSGLIRCSDHGAETTDWATDLRWATWWRLAAEPLAEAALVALETHSLERRGLTTLLREIRTGEASLVAEYRSWRGLDPNLTAALTKAGQQSDARVQKRVALWIRRFDEAQSA
jgi:hypothetical protein